MSKSKSNMHAVIKGKNLSAAQTIAMASTFVGIAYDVRIKTPVNAATKKPKP